MFCTWACVKQFQVSCCPRELASMLSCTWIQFKVHLKSNLMKRNFALLDFFLSVLDTNPVLYIKWVQSKNIWWFISRQNFSHLIKCCLETYMYWHWWFSSNLATENWFLRVYLAAWVLLTVFLIYLFIYFVVETKMGVVYVAGSF